MDQKLVLDLDQQVSDQQVTLEVCLNCFKQRRMDRCAHRYLPQDLGTYKGQVFRARYIVLGS